jgi:hypothetical protein
MKRVLLICALVTSCLGALVVTRQSTKGPSTPAPDRLSRLFPAGALLYLEAQNFSALLTAWDDSPEKKAWLASGNFSVFSNSRLLQRLAEARNQFAKAAGVPADARFLREAAGTNSAFAWYDIGKLEFLYLSRVSAAPATESALWQVRNSFQPRSVGEDQFFVRTDAETGRVVAFAVKGDYLLLATREDLLAAALRLMSSPGGATIETEGWWATTAQAAPTPGELRLILNLEKIVPSPYFRTYWIQQNITAMKQYSAAVVDLRRSAHEYREDRLLVRKATDTPPPSPEATRALVELSRSLPARSGAYQLRAAPSVENVAEELRALLLHPAQSAPAPATNAPVVSLGSGTVGQGSDLETRIDQENQRIAVQDETSPLRDLIREASPQAMLVARSTQLGKEGVFVRFRSLVALRSQANWNEGSVSAALVQALKPSLTAGVLGVSWRRTPEGVQQLDGLASLYVAVRGPVLFLTNDSELLQEAVAARSAAASSSVYVARFDHSRERTNLVHASKLTDLNSSTANAGYAAQNTPLFFSQNLAGLSEALKRVSSESIVVEDRGSQQVQTVTYEWAQ